MKTTMYIVMLDDCIEGSAACPTLKEALRTRRDNAIPGVDGRIVKYTVTYESIRELACNAYNREQLCHLGDDVDVAPNLPSPHPRRVSLLPKD